MELRHPARSSQSGTPLISFVIGLNCIPQVPIRPTLPATETVTVCENQGERV